MKDEQHMPASGKVYPHILITGSFTDCHDMYRWSNGLAQVDCDIPELDKLLAEITEGCRTDMEKIRNTYTWVQQNIRYIAFEAGISGHKPDTPAEVLRKRYGDCKGMAILLRTLLKAQGFDARLTDIGTIDIPYRMSEIATLASVNHMICSLIYRGKTYYLDATNEYINPEFIPGSIQGREAVIENGEDCIVHILPILNSNASTDSLSYTCTLSDKQTNKVLQGNATRSWSGDMKEFFLTAYHENDKSSQEEYLPRILTGNNHNYQVDSVSWIQQKPQQKWAILTGKVINSSAVQVADGEFYIELDLHNDLFDQPIDTAKRIHDYELPLRCRIVRHTELEIPSGYVLVYCPEGISIHTPQGILCCSYKTEGNKIIPESNGDNRKTYSPRRNYNLERILAEMGRCIQRTNHPQKTIIMKQNMLFLMGVLALLFITLMPMPMTKRNTNSLRRKREKKSGHWNCLNLPTRLFPKNTRTNQLSFWLRTAG